MPASRVKGPVPRWAEALLAADGALLALAHVASAVLRDIACVGLTPDQRTALTVRRYEETPQYHSDSDFVQYGLFAWERETIGHPLFPSKGRILLGAAGGGRELTALEDAGYQVTAFDPGARFHESLQQHSETAIILRGSYEDLVDAVEKGVGPLLPLVDDSYDAVILGWGSLSNVLDADMVIRLLAAIRRIAPSAPVMGSVLRAQPDELSSHSPAIARARRRLHARSGTYGVRYRPSAGFHRQYTASELADVAGRGGYHIVASHWFDFPHVLMVPAAGVVS